MTEQALERLAELQREYEVGQRRLQELVAQEVSIRETLLRISGAIQVLQELTGNRSLPQARPPSHRMQRRMPRRAHPRVAPDTRTPEPGTVLRVTDAGRSDHQQGWLPGVHPPGGATVSGVSSRLTVGGNGVLLSGKESGLDFAGCSNQTTTNPSSRPRASATRRPRGWPRSSRSAGRRARRAGHGTDPSKATPAVPGTWSVSAAGQSKLKAV